MYQQSFADVEHSKHTKQSKRELFLNEMEQVILWKMLREHIRRLYHIKWTKSSKNDAQ